jgi:ATP-dependent protease HslVU (ClpYQ) peptidase subunit
MTAIAAITNGKKVYIGGDSAGVAGLSVTVRKDPKVFKNSNFVIGFTSSFRMGQLLQYVFKPPKQPEKMKDATYMYTKFIDSVRKCLKDGGYARTSNNVESGGKFIVGYKGTLYVVDSDFQIGMPSSNYYAVGCGNDLCLGSLYSTDGSKMKPEERIMLALGAAEQFSGGVRSPFVIVSG